MDSSSSNHESRPSSGMASATDAAILLQTGLEALQRKQLSQAIAALEAVYQSPASPSTRLKAQVGLVKAYHLQGNWQQAIAHCQPLGESGNSQVRQWAQQVMDTLKQRQASAPSPSSLEESDRAVLVPSTAVTQTATQSETQPEDAASNPSLVLRQAGRAQKWSPLKSPDRSVLWGMQAVTGIALIGLVWGLITLLLSFNNFLGENIGWLQRFLYYRNPLGWIGLGLAGLYVGSPWLLDRILQRFYGATTLSLDDLAAPSPEATRLLRRLCHPQRLPLPKLTQLPTAAPLIFTYGSFPQTARIAVSQGLLDQLQEDEIAAVYAGELAHIQLAEFGILSLVTLMAQIPFLLYWQVAAWGDRQSQRGLQRFAAVVSSLGYLLYWLLRWAGVGLARVRVNFSDRIACEVTGNPNGLVRSLLKIARGTLQEIQQTGYTSALLESFDLLTPITPSIALLWGNPTSCLSIPWEQHNPYRYWLVLNQAHPLMGDRLQRLSQYARQWRLPSELDLSTPVESQPIPQRRFWLQIAPWLGMLLGAAIAFGLWGVGAMANYWGWLSLSWMQGDQSLLWGGISIGSSIGMFLRINRLFPDIKRPTQPDRAALAKLLAAQRLPVEGQPVQLQGTLIGRHGIANALNQDLILHSPVGSIKLHHTPTWTLRNLVPRSQRPHDYPPAVTVVGWLRQGAMVWVDVDRIRPQRGAVIQGNLPIVTTSIAVLTALAGVWLISQGGRWG